MPQFVVLAYDGIDEQAPFRRMKARQAHIDACEVLKTKGNALCGAAILNAKEEMIGSVMIMDFPNRNALDAWLAKEPYVIHKVWNRVEVLPSRLGPSFTGLLKEQPNG